MSYHVSWKKASYGKTTSKSGGGKLQAVATEGAKGLVNGTEPIPKSNANSKPSGGWVDAPGMKGDMGTAGAKAKSKSAKAPKSE